MMMMRVRHLNLINKNIIRSFHNSNHVNAGFFSRLFGMGSDSNVKFDAANKPLEKKKTFAEVIFSNREGLSYDEEHIKEILANNKKWVDSTNAKGIIISICYFFFHCLIHSLIHWLNH